MPDLAGRGEYPIGSYGASPFADSASVRDASESRPDEAGWWLASDGKWYPPERSPAVTDIRFAGGSELPGRSGRWTSPLTALSLSDSGIRFGFVGPLRRFAGEREASYAEIKSAQAVKGAFFNRGVLFKVRDAVWVFWTNPGPKDVRDLVIDAILVACAQHGVTVVEGERWTNGRS
jgi:hypothetical protein